MVLEPTKENLEKIIIFEKYILAKNQTLYKDIAKQSKIVRILRMTMYNFDVYKILRKYKIKKLKNRHK